MIMITCSQNIHVNLDFSSCLFASGSQHNTTSQVSSSLKGTLYGTILFHRMGFHMQPSLQMSAFHNSNIVDL